MNTLTIVIPTNNRPALLRRSLLFWSKQKFDIIVCDGSDESQENWVSDLCATNVEYYYSRTPFPQRIKLAADAIKTKYCMLLSDDEFYVPSALQECVNFLDKNKDYVAAGGVAVGFSPGKARILGFEQYPEWIGRERIESSPDERVLAHMGSYTNYLSGCVTRNDIWKAIASLYASREYPIFALWELEMNLILSYCGKSKVLGNLMHFRSHGEAVPIRNNIPSLSYKNRLCDVWQSDKHCDLRSEFLLAVSSVCENFVDVGLVNRSAVSAVEGAIDAYCQSQEKRAARKGYSYPFMKAILDSIRSRLLGLAFRLKSRFFMSRGYGSLESAIRRLEHSGVRINRHDVNEIVVSIKDFYGYR